MQRRNDEIMEDFSCLTCALSGENLYCDGLASSEEVENSLHSIIEEWKKLEQEIGFKVTETDVSKWYNTQHPYIAKVEVLPEPVVKRKKNFFGV